MKFESTKSGKVTVAILPSSTCLPVQNNVSELNNVYGKLLAACPLWRPGILRKHKIHKQIVLSSIYFMMEVTVL